MLIGITGGTGYVGFRLALALLRQAPLCHVRLLDVRDFDQIRCQGPCRSLYHDDQSINQSNDRTVNQSNNQSMNRHNDFRPKNPSRTSNQYPVCIHELLPDELERLSFKHCDLTINQSVVDGCEGLDILYHIASYGMSGKEMMNPFIIQSVNVDGTQRCIDACLKHKIKSIIYVSTYNVIFANQSLIGVDESHPYLDDSQHFDSYSRSKAQAEKLILAAAGPNARSERTESSNDLRAVVIRPAAIFGDGEERHLPRILSLVQRGLAVAAIGDPSVLCDWIYIDNLVHALIRAQQLAQSWTQLSHSPHHAVFAVSDDKPVNNFSFLARLIRGLGYQSIFLFYVPTGIMFALASAMEWSHRCISLLSPKLAIQPLLTRAEVCKVAVTHWCSVKRAKQQLGWIVIVSPDEAIKRCIKYYARAGLRSESEQSLQQRQKSIRLIVACILAAILIALLVIRRT